MNKLTGWIKQHQVAAFFLLAFAILYDRMWEKLPADSRAVYRTPLRAEAPDGGIRHETV